MPTWMASPCAPSRTSSSSSKSRSHATKPGQPPSRCATNPAAATFANVPFLLHAHSPPLGAPGAHLSYFRVLFRARRYYACFFKLCPVAFDKPLSLQRIHHVLPRPVDRKDVV